MSRQCTGCGLHRLDAISAILNGRVACCPDCSTLTVEERNLIRHAASPSRLTLGVTDLFPPSDSEIKAWADSCDCVPPETLVNEDDEDGYGFIFRPAQFYETVRAALARWGADGVALQQQAAELAECREALRRVRLEQRLPGGGW